MAGHEPGTAPMKVLVTGATGYVGSHVVTALLADGHDVRVLVRSREKLHRAFDGPTVDRLEVVVGDMLDRFTVAEAVRGCDAVVHTAGVVGVSRAGDASRTANVDGTRLVVGAAVEAGCDPVIYTSSVSTLIPTTDPVLTPDTPLAEAPGDYGRSKVEAERFVRALQAEGAPVTTFVIGGVYGPDQPALASAMESIVAASSQLMVIPGGGIGIIDVRDLALLVAAALRPGRGPRRYLAGGQFLTWGEWTDVLSEVIGRPVRRMRIPDRVLQGDGRRARRREARRGPGLPAHLRGRGGDDRHAAQRRLRHPGRPGRGLPAGAGDPGGLRPLADRGRVPGAPVRPRPGGPGHGHPGGAARRRRGTRRPT